MTSLPASATSRIESLQRLCARVFVFVSLVALALVAARDASGSLPGSDQMSSSEPSVQRPTISITRESTVTAGLPIRLKALGSAEFVSPAEARMALETIILDPMRADEVRVLKNAEVMSILRHRMPEVTSVRWTYFVPQTITLRAKASNVSELEVRNEIRLSLLEKCAECSRVSVSELRMPRIIPNSQIREYRLGTEALKLNPTFLLPLTVVDQASDRTYWVSGTAKVFRQTATLSRPLAMGARIQPEDLRNQEVDIARLREEPLGQDALVGNLLVRSLRSGSTISAQDIRREAVIRRGQSVRAILGEAGFEITAPGTAEDSGSIGDLIKIRTGDSKKTLTGRVISAGLVRIE